MATRPKEWTRTFLWFPRRNSVTIEALGISPQDLYWGRVMRVWMYHPELADRMIYATVSAVAAAKLKNPDRTPTEHYRNERSF